MEVPRPGQIQRQTGISGRQAALISDGKCSADSSAGRTDRSGSPQPPARWLATVPVPLAASVTPPILDETSCVPLAASSTLRAISWVAAPCFVPRLRRWRSQSGRSRLIVLPIEAMARHGVLGGALHPRDLGADLFGGAWEVCASPGFRLRRDHPLRSPCRLRRRGPLRWWRSAPKDWSDRRSR